MIKYLGSKRTLLPLLLQAIGALTPTGTVVDLFSGTSRVGHALKRAGYRVRANDVNAYAETLARCYVEADRDEVVGDAARLIDELNRLPGSPGYFTETFCERSRYLRPENGARVDAIRERIDTLDVSPHLRAVLLVSLMEAADRVDSTTGVQMAFLKGWSARSGNPLQLRVPDVLPRARSGPGEAHGRDALACVGDLEGDVCYLDPPYNQHSYLGNYHVWETLVRWDRPAVYGVACKRVDCRERRSPFNGKRTAADSLGRVITATPARHVVVSFNDEGYVTRGEIEELLARRGDVVAISTDFPRYVGARIGIHNPRGERVGTPGRLRNREYVFVASPDRAAIERVRAIAARPGSEYP